MSMSNFETQAAKIRNQPGFIAALDQSGGSTPKALKLYGIEENTYSGEQQMMDLVHQMRTRIVTSPVFSGNRIAGVFTHEFGHAINLSHSQVNGPMVYQSYTYAPYQPGVKGCVAPVHRYDYPDGFGATPANPATPAHRRSPSRCAASRCARSHCGSGPGSCGRRRARASSTA